MPGDEPVQGKGGKFNIFHAAKINEINEYYRQARYATGQLFVGNVITSLVVNTFFNPSLWELVHQMIKAEVVMVPLPRDWERKSYYEYFDKLLREDELMAVAIYRRAEVVMVPLPRDWEGKSYYEYFDKLLREDELMAVAIYRRSEAVHKEAARKGSK